MFYLRIPGSRDRQESPALALLNLFSLRILWQQRFTGIPRSGTPEPVQPEDSLAAELDGYSVQGFPGS
jgi:hypothetical protein